MGKLSDLIAPLWIRQWPCYILLACRTAFGNMLSVWQLIHTTAPHPICLSGELQLRPGNLVKFQMSPIPVSLDAKGTCMCPQTSDANKMKRLLKPCVAGMGLVQRDATYGGNIPAPPNCLER